MSSLNLPCFSSQPLPCPVTTALLKSLPPILPCKLPKSCSKVSWSCLTTILNNPNSPNFSSWQRYSFSLINFVALLWAYSNRGQCLSCAGDPRAGRSAPSGLSPEQSRGAPSPWCRATFGAAQGTVVGFLGWECMLLAHVQFSIQ